MEGWVVLLIIMIIVLMLPSLYTMGLNNGKTLSGETYMRQPLERFVLKGGNAACCKFGFSPHQYVLTGPPGNVFRPWYMTQ